MKNKPHINLPPEMSELLKNEKKQQEIMQVETTKQHRLALPSIGPRVLLTLDDKKALRALIDADIKFRNSKLRGYCLRIEDINQVANTQMLEVKCNYRVVIKQFER